jgi:hypothetical protein
MHIQFGEIIGNSIVAGEVFYRNGVDDDIGPFRYAN